MAYLYYAVAEPNEDVRPTDYTVDDVSAFSKHFARADYLFWLLALGKCRKLVVTDADGRVAHTTRVVGKCLKFPFLSKDAAVIGPSLTGEEFRGRGIFTAALQTIRRSCRYREYYAFVNEHNTPSIKGLEKAGFTRIGTAKKVRGQWQISKEKTAG